MSEKLYHSLQHHPDGLDIRLKQIDSFKNSIQKIKDIKTFYNQEAIKYKKKLINALIQPLMEF